MFYLGVFDSVEKFTVVYVKGSTKKTDENYLLCPSF